MRTEDIFETFAARLNNPTSDPTAPGIGLALESDRPFFGAPVASIPSALIAFEALTGGNERRLGSPAPMGHQIETMLYIFAGGEIELWRYADALRTLHKAYTVMAVNGQDVRIEWGRAVSPPPVEWQDPSTYYHVQQPVAFRWH